MNNPTIVDDVIEDKLRTIKSIAKDIALIERDRAFYEELGVVPQFYGKTITFWGTTHEQAITIIKHFGGGRWDKTYHSEAVSYKNTTEDGRIVEIEYSKPPEHCKIEEFEEVVPAHVVPEQIVKKRKIVCNPPDNGVALQSTDVAQEVL